MGRARRGRLGGRRSAARAADIIAVVGLAVGAVFGLAGTFVGSAPLRQTFWMIDGVGLVVAAALLTLRYFRRDIDIVAAGFLVFLIGQGLIVGSNAAGLQGSAPMFGGGVALWAAGLLLISATGVFPAWVRALGGIAAILFAIVAFRIAWGEPVVPTSRPLPFFAYPFLVLTFAGWIRALLQD